MKVVLSVGGSSVNPDGKPDCSFVTSLVSVLKESGFKLGILVGGGRPAREYASAVRKLGGSEYDADSVAIMSTRQNAALVLTALGKQVCPSVLTDFEDARRASDQYDIVVMGGTIPGITTDTDAVLLAESIGAKRLVNISNVNGIYDSNPGKNKNAKKYDSLDYQQLISLATESDKRSAGTNFVFDLLACKLIARSKIETHFVSCNEIKDIKNAIKGKKHGGTVVK